VNNILDNNNLLIKGGATILTTYGSVAKALWKAFPDLFQG